MRYAILCWVLLAVSSTPIARPAFADTESDEGNITPRLVLEHMQKRLSAISNYQCTHRSTCIRRDRQDPNRPPVREVTARHYLAYDRQGHGRVRELYENLDACSYIWNGVHAIEVREKVSPNGTVSYSTSSVPGRHYRVDQNNTPWIYLGGTLARMLTKALDEGTEVSIERVEDGLCRLEIRYDYGSTMAADLDPKRDYLPVAQQIIVQGEMRRDEAIDFAKIDPGIWFPVEVRMQPGPSANKAISFIQGFTDVRLNDPDFDRLLAPPSSDR